MRQEPELAVNLYDNFHDVPFYRTERCKGVSKYQYITVTALWR